MLKSKAMKEKGFFGKLVNGAACVPQAKRVSQGVGFPEQFPFTRRIGKHQGQEMSKIRFKKREGRTLWL